MQCFISEYNEENNIKLLLEEKENRFVRFSHIWGGMVPDSGDLTQTPFLLHCTSILCNRSGQILDKSKQ